MTSRLKGWPTAFVAHLFESDREVLIPPGWDFHRWFHFQYETGIPLERWSSSQRAALSRIEKLGTTRQVGPLNSIFHYHAGWPHRTRPKSGSTALRDLQWGYGTSTDRVDITAEAERLPTLFDPVLGKRTRWAPYYWRWSRSRRR